MSMADRVAVMNEGTIRQVAPPDELYSRPRTEWVARFIGSPPMNLFRGTRRNGSIDLGEAGTITLDGAGGGERAGTETGARDLVQADEREDPGTAALEADVSLGVRPEDISVTTDPPSGGNSIEGTVDTVEPLGEYTIVNVTANDQLVNAKVSETSVTRDDRAYLTFDDRDAYLYDENGELVT